MELQNTCAMISIGLLIIVFEKENHDVTIPNGTKTNIKYKGTVVLQNGITLHNVLFVPRFKYNLISISKMSIDLNCQFFS